MKSPQLMRGYSSDDKQSTSINVQHGKIIRNGTYIQAHDACSSQSRMNIVRGRKCHGTRNIDKKRDTEKKKSEKNHHRVEAGYLVVERVWFLWLQLANKQNYTTKQNSFPVTLLEFKPKLHQFSTFKSDKFLFGALFAQGSKMITIQVFS